MIPIKRIVFSCFVLLVISSDSYSQTNELSKFELGLEGGVGIAYRWYKVIEQSSSADFAKESLDRREHSSTLPQGSLLFSWNPSNRIRLSGGVSYSVRGFETDWWAQNSNVFPPPSDPEFYRYNSRSKWIDIPLQVDAFLWKRPKRLNLFVRGGLSFGSQLSAEATFETQSQGYVKTTVSDDLSIKKSLFLVKVGGGMSYRIAGSFQAELVIQYEQSLNSFINDKYTGNLLKGYFIYLGPQLRLTYGF